MALLIEKPWRTQPKGVVVPRYPGLTFFADPAQGIFWAKNGGQKLTTNARIITRDYAGTNNATIDNARYQALYYTPSGPESVIVLGSFQALNNSNEYPSFVAGSDFNVSNRGGLDIGLNGGATEGSSTFRHFYAVSRSNTYTANQAIQWTNELAVANKLYLLMVRHNGSTTAQFVINGNVYSFSTFAPPGANTLNDLRFGDNGIAGRNCYTYYVAKVNRWVTDGEYRRLFSDPWLFLRPLELQLNSPPAPRIYYVAGPNSTWATPTSTQIINGQLSGGGAATASWSESAPLQTTIPFNFSQPASPLTTGTKYRAAAVQKAGDSNVVSNVVESDPFLAGAATLSNPEAVNITDTAATPKVTVSY